MLKELVEFLLDTGRDNIRPEVFGLKMNDPRTALVVDNLGEITEHDLGTVARKFECRTLQSFAEACVRYAQPVVDADDAKQISVWVDTNRITGILDDDDGRLSTAVIDVRISPYFGIVQKIGEQPLSLKDICVLLRQKIQPAACTIDPPELRVALASMKFTESVEAVNQTKVSSMGRSITAQAKGDDGLKDVPQAVSFTFESYPGITGPVTVQCALEILHDTKQVHLVPLPGEIEMAKETGLEHLRVKTAEAFAAVGSERKADVEINIFCGKPSN